jgi:hypothetical protein
MQFTILAVVVSRSDGVRQIHSSLVVHGDGPHVRVQKRSRRLHQEGRFPTAALIPHSGWFRRPIVSPLGLPNLGLPNLDLPVP